MSGGEALEERCLLAADLSYDEVAAQWTATLGVDPIAMPLTHVVAEPLAGTAKTTGFSPTQIRAAYGFDNIYFQGNTIVGDGTGQTIAIVNAYHTPNAANDLAAFSAYYGLPAASFTQVDQYGGTNYTTSVGAWALETALDVQWVHALAPGASILLVEANSASFSDLMAAVDYARNVPGVSAVSMSWGAAEWSGETYYNQFLTTPAGHAGVTFFAAAGNSGGPGVYPAYSPNVVAVGGTTVTLNGSNQILSETAWSGSGGGVSQYQSQPSWQNGVVTQSATQRVMPDVAFLGNPNTGVAVYDTYNNSSSTPWSKVAGTSFAAPSWASLVTIANQGRTLAGLPVFDMNALMTRLYSMPASNFNDIVSGSSGGTIPQAAGPGFDAVTGRGTPKAALVVDSLVGVSAAPTGVTLMAISDTGISNSDRITRLNNSNAGQRLQFQVSGTTAGATVQLFAGGVLIGSAVATGNMTVVTTNGSFTLVDGLHSITAKQAKPAELSSAASPALQVTIDATAPTAAFVAVSPDPHANPVSNIALTFSEVVSGLNLNAFSLSRDGGANLLSDAQTLSTTDNIQWTLGNLSSITTMPGFYTLVLISNMSPVIDVAGNVAGGAHDTFTVLVNVLNRMLFYNQSKFDGNDSAINDADDNAIAIDKQPYFAGSGLAEFSSVSSYSHGINGLMIDIAGSHPNITAADFNFLVGNSNSLAGWTTAPAPTDVSVRAGAGIGGSDRVVITWANGAIVNQWLEVTLLANGNTGLPSSDTFYFGNRIGDTGLDTPPSFFVTGLADEFAVRNHPAFLQEITNIYDFNRDMVVGLSDQLLARNNPGFLTRLNLAAPFAAPSAMTLVAEDGSQAPVAVALTVPTTSGSEPFVEPAAAMFPSPEAVPAESQVLAELPAMRRVDRGLAFALAHEWLRRTSESSQDPTLEESLIELLSATQLRHARRR